MIVWPRSTYRFFYGYGNSDTVIPKPEIFATAAWLDEHTFLTAKGYRGLDHAVSSMSSAICETGWPCTTSHQGVAVVRRGGRAAPRYSGNALD